MYPVCVPVQVPFFARRATIEDAENRITTAGDEFNLCVRVLQKIVANDEAKSKELGYQSSL